MKPSIVLTLFIFVLEVQEALVTNTEEYVRLISGVYDFHRGSSIIIYFGSDSGPAERNKIFNIAFTFSRNGIMTVLASFEDAEKLRTYNDEKREFMLPVLVIFITTEKSLQKYLYQLSNNLTPNYRRPLFRKLILFIETNSGKEKPLQDFCTKPVGNPFRLRFDSQILVKCYDDTKIREWYSVKGNETDIKDFATWDDRLVRLDNLTLYERRGGLRGKILKIATIKNAVGLRRENKELVGYIGKIVESIKEVVNFSLKFVPEEDDNGNWDENTRTWSGVMNLLHRAEVDFSASDLTMTAERAYFVDFTTPLIMAENFLHIKKPEGSLEWTGHFKTFGKPVWISIIVFILVTPILLTLMKMEIQPFYTFSNLISENYLHIWGIFCQQGLTEFPTTTTLRIAYFSICSLSVVIWSAYCASFTSIVNVPNSDVELKSIGDFVSDGSYKLIVLKNSADYQFFHHEADDDRSKALNRLMLRRDELPENVTAGFKMVCEQKVAFYINLYIKKLVEKDITCEVYKISTRNFDQIGITLPKNSQYRDVINYYIQKIENSGLLNRLQTIYYNKFLDTRELKSEKYKPVELPFVALPLAITMLGIILGGIILFLEIIFSSFNNRKGRNQAKVLSPNIPISLEESEDFSRYKNKEHIEKRVVNVKFLHSSYKHRIVVTPGNESVNFKI